MIYRLNVLIVLASVATGVTNNYPGTSAPAEQWAVWPLEDQAIVEIQGPTTTSMESACIIPYTITKPFSMENVQEPLSEARFRQLNGNHGDDPAT